MRACFRRHCVCGTPVLQLSPSDNPGRSQGSRGNATCEKDYYNYACLRRSPLSPVLIGQKLTRRHRDSDLPRWAKAARFASPHGRNDGGEKPRGREPAVGSRRCCRGPAGRTAAPPVSRGSLSRPEQEVFPGPFPAGRQRCLCGLTLPARSRFAYMNVKSNYVGSFA